MQYLEVHPHLEDAWQADMVRLLDALNDYLIEIKINTSNHVIHARISEIQHGLEHVAQEFLNVDKNPAKNMGYGYLRNWQEKNKKYKKVHKDTKAVKAAVKHPSYIALKKARSLFKVLAKTTEMLIKKKKFRNFILLEWFKVMTKYLQLISTYEKLK